ncbi:MAG: patatin-like phospholipase family protein [Planctomycetota bacterium]
MKIGLALSGGGIRAAVFHLGVLERLARQNLLEHVTFLSTVSGGSLAIGLVLTKSGNQWPLSTKCREETVPMIRSTLTTKRLQAAYVLRVIVAPWQLLRGRANVLGTAIASMWGVSADIAALPPSPRWIINATCYETGKNWRFERRRMGDYIANYVLAPRFPLADALAVSAAVPGAIGPLVLRCGEFKWHAYPKDRHTDPQPVAPSFAKLHLWDGGVYDNSGLEALYKPHSGFRENIDFLVVSDASALVGEARHSRWTWPMRLINITMDQVRGLRARMVVDHLQSNPGTGAYLQIGNTPEQIYRKANVTVPPDCTRYAERQAADAQAAAAFPTTLQRLSATEFEQLFRHGYEVADATLNAYCADSFDCMPFDE